MPMQNLPRFRRQKTFYTFVFLVYALLALLLMIVGIGYGIYELFGINLDPAYGWQTLLGIWMALLGVIVIPVALTVSLLCWWDWRVMLPTVFLFLSIWGMTAGTAQQYLITYSAAGYVATVVIGAITWYRTERNMVHKGPNKR